MTTKVANNKALASAWCLKIRDKFVTLSCEIECCGLNLTSMGLRVDFNL